jgi:tRNA threonylcarbamoyladenosine biosynthesis protein TsaB
LAFGLDRPVLPVSNLAVLAQRAYREHGARQVAAAIDARMDEVYWGCYQDTSGEMRLVGDEAVLPPEHAALPLDGSGDWFGAGTGWGYANRIPVTLAGMDSTMLPHAQDLLTLATYAWNRGEAIIADQAQPVYLRDKVATPKAR